MREILFRGKRTDNGEWVYGNFVRGCDEKYAYIVEFGNKEMCRNYVNVNPDTVGQYTSLTNKNGTKIFEGDVVTAPYIDPIFHSVWNEGNLTENAVVKYADSMFYIEYVESKQKITLFGLLSGAKEAEVIGNIHDNKLEDFQNGC